jgi:hypothetical protein
MILGQGNLAAEECFHRWGILLWKDSPVIIKLSCNRLHQGGFPCRKPTNFGSDLASNPKDSEGKDWTVEFLPIAVTETNSDWSKAVGGEATPDSFYNAIWWADSLGRMIQKGVLLTKDWVISYNQGGL